MSYYLSDALPVFSKYNKQLNIGDFCDANAVHANAPVIVEYMC